MRARKYVPWFIIILLAFGTTALAADPQSVLQKEIDEVITILKDPKYTDKSESGEQYKEIKKQVANIFDYGGVGRLTVGNYWDRFSEEQKNEFTDLFAELLGTNYIRRIQSYYTNEVVEITGQEKLSDTKALVRSRIIRQSGDIPVEYSMWNRTGVWRVYDVRIEGVSLIKNYRAQFSDILVNHPPAYLIEQVKIKIEEQKKEGQAD